MEHSEHSLRNALEDLHKAGVDPAELVDVESLEPGGKGLGGRTKGMDWRLRREGTDAYRTYMGDNDEMVGAELREENEQKSEGLTEQERAQKYWESRLSGEHLIDTPQNPQCEIAIVVPVYREKPESILKQLESLRAQQGIDLSLVEIIYVVNNDIDDGSPKSEKVLEANRKVMETIRGITDLNVFVIDKSSAGNEIAGCNVGRARNRGVAEASYRFHQNRKNGILLQTDADTYIEDPHYLANLYKLTQDDPDIIGIAGGIIFEFSPDTEDPDEIEDLRRKVRLMDLQHDWESLVQFLRDPHEHITLQTESFSGAHMLSRSYESAVIGGLIDTNMGEDPQFGGDLEKHAAQRGQKVLGMRQNLKVVTALRESDRTGASFKKDFENINPDKATLVPDPFVSETLPQFRHMVYGALEKAIVDPTELRQLFMNEHGTLIVSEESFAELIDEVRINGVQEDYRYLQKWVKENFGAGFDVVLDLYDSRHPQVPITEDNYEKLQRKVMETPGGAKFMERMDSQKIKIRIP